MTIQEALKKNNNDFEQLVICKHGRLSRLIDINTQEHKHLNLWDLVKLCIGLNERRNKTNSKG